ncbi:hypothetical protein ES319_A11G005200v1 [Gossypium barbadense]|uniref:Uncharacterized protein n=1 Tax=Gossypium barbadense TaxID=3634 RepID=A0A5J5TGD8_GOSBA|nr:hypothetical protein ES319_A11G005200v1 [Gossypium barbadense]
MGLMPFAFLLSHLIETSLLFSKAKWDFKLFSSSFFFILVYENKERKERELTYQAFIVMISGHFFSTPSATRYGGGPASCLGENLTERSLGFCLEKGFVSLKKI